MTERFTVYDVFAVLVPGTVFSFLFAVTLRHLAGVQILDWTGGFGDATVLVITGYAAGVLLQAVGNGLAKVVRRRRPGVPAIPRLLLPESSHYSEELKREAMGALERRYGPLPESQHPAYRRLLEEKTFRLYYYY